ncbi:MAG: TonB-dependent receptor [Pseudomonadota bacterium]
MKNFVTLAPFRAVPPLAPERLASALLFSVALCPAAWAQTSEARTLERVIVTGGRPSSLPTQIPTTTEGVRGEQVEQAINATDAQDALKYLPSLTVRKRYIGDHDHAVLATRASGSGNSARSLVYADGLLLSNLLGNGASFTPRWGLVTPEEIDRVDVLYGPFSAAYPGNSAGAIVDYVTRMPQRFEAHVKVQAFSQRHDLAQTHERYNGHQGSASLGSRDGALSWWVNLNRLDSDAQPMAFATRQVSQGTPGAAGTPVTGGVVQNNPRQQPWVLFGSTGQTHTVQDHAKLKLAYDFSPTVRAAYTLGLWRNDADRASASFLRDAAGQPVYSGTVNLDNRSYTLTPADLAPSQARLEHVAHGVSVKSHTRGLWDWEAAASLYDYHQDQVRTPTVALPGAEQGGPGRITDQDGTGWNTLALKGIWRPQGLQGPHIVEFGVQRDAFALRTLVSNTAAWIDGVPGTRVSAFTGDSTLSSLWVQDAWRFAPDWKAVLGGRWEHWRADNGSVSGASGTVALGARSESHLSPKAALSYQLTEAWSLKASLGRAVRMPTVSELYQGTVTTNQIVNNDPNLRPETSWTTEFSAERELAEGSLRGTVFFERSRDALYAQTDTRVSPNVTNIQNVDAVRTAGLEGAYQARNVGWKGVDLTGSLTFADSVITANARNPDSVGKWQPRVPRWRAGLLASYAPTERWNASLGARYSGRQYGQLDNSDTVDQVYQSFSRYFVTDVRMQYRVDAQWRLSAGIDNLNNRTYWAFHPYPQRTFHLELRCDL